MTVLYYTKEDSIIMSDKDDEGLKVYNFVPKHTPVVKMGSLITGDGLKIEKSRKYLRIYGTPTVKGRFPMWIYPYTNDYEVKWSFSYSRINKRSFTVMWIEFSQIDQISAKFKDEIIQYLRPYVPIMTISTKHLHDITIIHSDT